MHRLIKCMANIVVFEWPGYQTHNNGSNLLLLLQFCSLIQPKEALWSFFWRSEKKFSTTQVISRLSPASFTLKAFYGEAAGGSTGWATCWLLCTRQKMMWHEPTNKALFNETWTMTSMFFASSDLLVKQNFPLIWDILADAQFSHQCDCRDLHLKEGSWDYRELAIMANGTLDEHNLELLDTARHRSCPSCSLLLSVHFLWRRPLKL